MDTCPKCGAELENGICPECGDEEEEEMEDEE